MTLSLHTRFDRARINLPPRFPVDLLGKNAKFLYNDFVLGLCLLSRDFVPFILFAMMRTSLLLLVSLALMGCDSEAGRTAPRMKIRKQVYNLTAADLSEHPVWEFAEDEEGTEGQDEATVRPF